MMLGLSFLSVPIVSAFDQGVYTFDFTSNSPDAQFSVTLRTGGLQGSNIRWTSRSTITAPSDEGWKIPYDNVANVIAVNIQVELTSDPSNFLGWETSTAGATIIQSTPPTAIGSQGFYSLTNAVNGNPMIVIIYSVDDMSLLPADLNLFAVFSSGASMYTCEVTSYDNDSGTVLLTDKGSSNYELSATSNIGYVFDHWEYANDVTQGEFVRDTENTGATIRVTLTEDTTYRAHFRPTAITKYEGSAYLCAFTESFVGSNIPDYYYQDYALTMIGFGTIGDGLPASTLTYVGDSAQLSLPILTADGTLPTNAFEGVGEWPVLTFSYDLYFGDTSDAALSSTSYINDGNREPYVGRDGYTSRLVLRFYIREMPDVSSVRLVVTIQGMEENEVTIEQTFAVAPVKLVAAEPIVVYMSVEKLTVQENFGTGSYYLVEPQAFTIDSNWNAARVLVELLKSHDLAYRNTGSVGSNFYLSAIWDSEENDGAGGYLSEFSYGMTSGWMYSVNNYFPGMGSTDWLLSDGDVIRWQYTCEGLGADLGGSWGVPSTFANKTMLLREYASLVAAGSSNEHLAYALSVLQTLNPTQEDVDTAYALLATGGSDDVTVVSAVPEAFVTQLNGNKNDLTITITEDLSDGTTNTLTETFSINNNAANTYTIGSYRVYVDTKGNTQIRDCYIITTQ